MASAESVLKKLVQKQCQIVSAKWNSCSVVSGIIAAAKLEFNFPNRPMFCLPVAHVSQPQLLLLHASS